MHQSRDRAQQDPHCSAPPQKRAVGGQEILQLGDEILLVFDSRLLSMSSAPTSLISYLEQVRIRVRQNAMLRAFVAWLGVAAWVFVSTTLYTAWSARGDLARPLALCALALAAWVCSAERFRSLGGRTPTQSDCAKAIAQVPSPGEPEITRLRQDIAAAHSLIICNTPSASPPLRDLYLRRVEQKLEALPPNKALPSPPWSSVLSSLSMGILGSLLVMFFLGDSAKALTKGVDLRPPRAAQSFWDAVGVKLEFPAHTQSPSQRLDPVAGTLKLPMGTKITAWVDLPAKAGFSKLELRDLDKPIVYKLAPASSSPRDAQTKKTARFTTTWVLQGPLNLELVGVDQESSTRRPKHAPVVSIQATRDQPAQVELSALGQQSRGDRESTLPVKIDARDDFGLRALRLYYQSPEHPPAFVEIPLEGQPKRYQNIFEWDLSTIPMERRSDLVYWIQARDNDPTLDPEDQLPGKRSNSARRTLILDDARERHQALLHQLAAVRDQAVDLLAKIMQPNSTKGLQARRVAARGFHEQSALFLTNLSRLVDRMRQNPLAARSTVRVLTQVHERTRHHYELAAPLFRFIYANRPSDPNTRRANDPWQDTQDPQVPRALALSSDRLRAALNEWTSQVPAAKSQLEDDVIRLDDLMDAELVEQLQSLLTAVRTSQAKLVRWLEKLDPKDASARTRIEQLEARIALDMRRIQELRALLREEVDPGFYNEDALAELAERMKHQSIKEKLAKGDLQGATDAAKNSLSEMDSAQKDLQGQKLNHQDLTPKEKAQRHLRKVLSEIKQRQADLEEQTPKRTLHTKTSAQQDRDFAKDLLGALQQVDDTTLNQPGRRAFERVKDAIEVLDRNQATPAERHRASEALRHHLNKAMQGASGRQKSELRRLQAQAQRRADQIPTLPRLEDERAIKTQDAIAKTLETLQKDTISQPAMEPALRELLSQAQSSMQESRQALSKGRALRSGMSQRSAQSELDRALDLLMQAPPPPPPKHSQSASTQAKQDRSLRQAVLKALKDREKTLRPGARAYYESLLEP